MKNSTMLSRSYWAKAHPKSAILVIAISKVVIGTIGLFLGISACFEGLTLDSTIGGIVFGIIATGCILLYPPKALKAKLGTVGYHRLQKQMDGVLFAFGFAFWFFIGNLLPNWVAQPETLASNILTTPTALSMAGQPKSAVQTTSPEHGGVFHKWLVKKAKSKIKRVIEKIGRLEGNQMNVILKLLMSIFVLAIAFGLGYLALGFGCSLSCAGQETLGIIVMIGGPLLFLFLGILTVYKMWHKKKGQGKDSFN